MKNNRRSLPQRTMSISPTKTEKLYSILLDRAWHATQELVREVGHTFAVAIFYLRRLGYSVDTRRSADHSRTFEYRLGIGKKPTATNKAPLNLPIDGFGKR